LIDRADATQAIDQQQSTVRRSSAAFA